MRNTTKNQTSLRIGVVIALMAALLVPGLASAQTPTVTIDLCATTGTLALPGGASVTTWGYVAGSTCAAGDATVPGPVIDVEVGTVLTVNLTNNLPENTALSFVGIPMVPDLTGVPNGGTASYTFTATEPGTFLYEAGMLPNAQHQTAMGMHGAMIVRPAAGQAYGPSSTFDDEAVLVLSEIDPALNEAVDPTLFDMRDFTPTYGLINGKAAPDTDPIATAAGNTVLLRYLNAGALHRSMNLLGASQTVIATDGSPLSHPYSVAAEDIAPGETLDTLVTVGAASPDARWPLYDGAFLLGGGMSTFIDVAGAPVEPPTTLDFNSLTIESYGGTQDGGGTATPSGDGTALALAGNTWKQIPLTTTIGSNTVLEFDFLATSQGEIHGIGFDTDSTLSANQIFQVYGTQRWGLLDFNNYPGAGAEGDLVHYTIPVGQFFTGTFDYLVFASDHDVAVPTAASAFSNVAIYDVDVPQAPRPPAVVDLSSSIFESYGGSQDASGGATVLDSGAGVSLDGNTWKAYPYNYTITPDTMFEFDFASQTQGEIHGIGFDTQAAAISPLLVFQLYGTQTWGLQDFRTIYSGTDVVHYTIPIGQFYTGPFSYLVFANDDDGAGGANSVFSNIEVYEIGETEGPDTTSLWLVPEPSGGTGNVILRATGDDTATGNSYVTGAEYFIDVDPGEGLATAMDLNLFAPIVAETALIDTTGLTEGSYVVSVRSMDEFNNWGPTTEITMTVDQTGPVVNTITLDPNPNNGSEPYNPSRRVVRVDVTITDGVSNLAAAEGMLYDANATYGPFGPFPLTSKDGVFDELGEDAYFDIPLPTIRLLTAGGDVQVRGLDASGNWGGYATATLTIETTAPVVSGVAATPNPTGGAASVVLSATATDAALAEWFTGPDPGEGNGTAMTVAGTDLTATIDVSTWANGDYVLNVRARDAAGNWSGVVSTTLVVDAPDPGPQLLYFSTLNGGNGNSVAGVPGPYDDADVYLWDAVLDSLGRDLDGSALGLPGNADIDGLAVDGDLYYVSFNRNLGVNVPSPGGGSFLAQDEDVVLFDAENGEWQMFFEGAECILNTTNSRDIDALDVLGGNLYFSTVGNVSVDGVAGPYDDADIYLWDGGGCSRVFDASVNGLPGNTDIDGLTVVDGDTFYLSFNRNLGTTIGGFGLVEDEDVVLFDGAAWSFYFDGSAYGLDASNGRDLDAIDVQ